MAYLETSFRAMAARSFGSPVAGAAQQLFQTCHLEWISYTCPITCDQNLSNRFLFSSLNSELNQLTVSHDCKVATLTKAAATRSSPWQLLVSVSVSICMR